MPPVWETVGLRFNADKERPPETSPRAVGAAGVPSICWPATLSREQL